MGTPHFAPSAKFQLILQVFPRSPRRGFASKCPGGQKSVYGQDTLMEGLRRLKTGGRKDELVEAVPALLPRHRRDAAGASRWAGRVRTFGWDRANIGAGTSPLFPAAARFACVRALCSHATRRSSTCQCARLAQPPWTPQAAWHRTSLKQRGASTPSPTSGRSAIQGPPCAATDDAETPKRGE